MLETGIEGRLERTVTGELTAKSVGSGQLEVFATPALIALLEETAWRSVAEHLEEGQGTVGTRVEVEHLAATPVGMKVWCETRLIRTEGRKLEFEAVLGDEAGVIARGSHVRCIVDNLRFQQRANEKAGSE